MDGDGEGAGAGEGEGVCAWEGRRGGRSEMGFEVAWWRKCSVLTQNHALVHMGGTHLLRAELEQGASLHEDVRLQRLGGTERPARAA